MNDLFLRVETALIIFSGFAFFVGIFFGVVLLAKLGLIAVCVVAAVMALACLPTLIRFVLYGD